MASSDSLLPTFGIWVVSAFLESILYGMGILQAFLYFQWYPKDSWAIKATVILAIVVESVQIGCFFHGTIFHLVENFGNPAGLLEIIVSDEIQLLCLYLSAIVVQMYFTYCIYIFAHRARPWAAVSITAALALLIMLELGASIAQVVQTDALKNFANLSSAKSMTSLQSATALVIDLSITLSLVLLLDRHRSDISSTNSMLNTLIVYAINRGMLTAACALVNLILFLALPGTFYFFVGLVCSSKLYVLYMNSMLATLNTRSYVRNMASNDWNTMPFNTANADSKPNIPHVGHPGRSTGNGSSTVVELSNLNAVSSMRPDEGKDLGTSKYMNGDIDSV